MKLQPEFIIGVIVICLIINTKDKALQKQLLFVLIICFIVSYIRSRYSTVQLNLINIDGINEVLLVESNIASSSTLFLLDTGYAGPPVLSRSYFAIRDYKDPNLAHRYNRILNDMKHVTEDDQHKAIATFINTNHCHNYTSGCTMKLMGIGSTMEQQADMILCPLLKLQTSAGTFFSSKSNSQTPADVFVTNSLENSIHILTCDFLLHSSPVLIDIQNQQMELNLSVSTYIQKVSLFHMQPLLLSGGAFVAEFNISGEIMKCTVDTGAPGPINLGINAINRLKKCYKSEDRFLRQIGVNGENVCSDIIVTDVMFCGKEMKNVPVFVNNSPTDFVDGYVGMGFLRAFNILISYNGIGFQKNNLEVRNFDYFAKHTSKGNCGTKIRCLNN